MWVGGAWGERGPATCCSLPRSHTSSQQAVAGKPCPQSSEGWQATVSVHGPGGQG